jgi:hypothetical protein
MLLALISLLFLPADFSPTTPRWGWDAHKMVCTIAWWEMGNETKAAVSDLIDTDMGYERFMESCLWADDVRGKIKKYDRWSTAHYVNLPRGAAQFELDRDCGDTFCVVEGIIESRATLSDPKTPSAGRLEALKFLSHFVGDIHQPMHAGYGDDRGGNDTKVDVFGSPSNLHAAWDYGILERTNLTWVDYASRLFFEITDEDRANWDVLDPATWTEESFAIISKTAYNFQDGQIGEAYYTKHIHILETRIKQAGVRLANDLDRIFAELK